MKNLFLAATVAVAVALVGCSGSSNPQDQLNSINELLAKKFPVAERQQKQFDELLAQGNKQISEGKGPEAAKTLGKALAILEMAEEQDRFNKSE